MQKLLVWIGIAVAVAAGLGACNDDSSSSDIPYDGRNGSGYQQSDSGYDDGGESSGWGQLDGGNTDRFDPHPAQGPYSPGY